jgi:catechol 2,3-dioxygenase-like lactoylglutathione lyase family enzyme
MAVISSARFRRLVRFSLTTANSERLAAFYIQAFGFRQVADVRLNGEAFHRMMGGDNDARCITLSLGCEVIELMEFDVPGAPYPDQTMACDTVFQHFAIVTADMAAAWSALQKTAGWSAITVAEPQRLPPASGGVTAFKFRDPEGHPLELLSFPPGRAPVKWQTHQQGQRCLGIDHSAIVVLNTQASTAFYTAHGLHLSSVSHNEGPEQNRLDGFAHAVVEVTGLAPGLTSPHLELLCYERRGPPLLLSCNSNDVAATRLIFQGDEAAVSRRLTDPDGHHLMVVPPCQLSRFA